MTYSFVISGLQVLITPNNQYGNRSLGEPKRITDEEQVKVT
jgi:glutathione peroxidase-family protein